MSDFVKDINVPTNDCISRQAAIDEIRKCRFVVDAIEKIRGLPSAQPDVSDTNVGDMVSRQAVKDWLLKWEGYIDMDTIARMQCRVIDIRPHRKKDVEQLPSAEPEIICCKDCKYVSTDATCCFVCNRDGMGLKPYNVYHDDFCSYAERRTHEAY